MLPDAQSIPQTCDPKLKKGRRTSRNLERRPRIHSHLTSDDGRSGGHDDRANGADRKDDHGDTGAGSAR